MLEKRNYEVNRNIDLGTGTVNGQGVGNISKCRYGICSMAWCGCEIIAVYNMLKISGVDDIPLADIAKEIYPYGSVLSGFFGTDPHRLIIFFRKHNITTHYTKRYSVFAQGFKGAKYGIVSFWNGPRLMSSLHTVCIENTGSGILVYNRSNKRTKPVLYKNLNEFCDMGHFIVGYFL